MPLLSAQLTSIQYLTPMPEKTQTLYSVSKPEYPATCEGVCFCVTIFQTRRGKPKSKLAFPAVVDPPITSRAGPTKICVTPTRRQQIQHVTFPQGIREFASPPSAQRKFNKFRPQQSKRKSASPANRALPAQIKICVTAAPRKLPRPSRVLIRVRLSLEDHARS
jgi:hypothetical protein